MRASAGQGPTPAPSPGTGHPGTGRLKPSQSPAGTIIPTDACLMPEASPLGNCHQAEEKTPQPHLLHSSSAFTEASILCEQRGLSSHSPGVGFTLELEEACALRSSFPVSPERLWSHSPWSPRDPHGRLLNFHGWLARVGKQCVYQRLGTIPGQVPLSEPRVSVLTAPSPAPCPCQLSPSPSQSLGLSSGLSPAQLLLPVPVPVTVTVMGERTHGGGLHVDPTDKST